MRLRKIIIPLLAVFLLTGCSNSNTSSSSNFDSTNSVQNSNFDNNSTSSFGDSSGCLSSNTCNTVNSVKTNSDQSSNSENNSMSSITSEAKKVALSTLYPWINEIEVDDIESVLLYRDLGSISPTYSSLNTYCIGSEKEKEETYSFLKNAVVKESVDPYWAGVGEKSLIIILKNGSTYSLSHIGDGFYVGKQYYEYSSFPSFSEYYANSFLYHCTFSLYNGDELVKEDVSEMRNIIFSSNCVDDYVQQDKFIPFTIRMGNEKIYIVDSRTFYIIRNNDKQYYQIINGYSFDNIISANT